MWVTRFAGAMTTLVRCAEWKPPGEAAPVRNLAELQLELQALLGSVTHARPLLVHLSISFAAPTTPLPRSAHARKPTRARAFHISSGWHYLCGVIVQDVAGVRGGRQ